MGPELLPYLLLGGGTLAQYMGQQQAADERRSILNRSMEQSQAASDKANSLVAQEGQKYAGDQRQQAMDTQAQQTFDQSQKDIAGAGAGIIDTAGDAGAVSPDFIRAKADKTLSEGNRLTAIARELSKARAPTALLNSEGQRRADVTSRVGSIFGSARNLADAAGQDAQSVEEPFWGQLGGLAQGIGSGMAMGGIGKVADPMAGYLKYGGAEGSLGGASTLKPRFGAINRLFGG